MSAPRNASIKSYFYPTGTAKSQAKTSVESVSMRTPGVTAKSTIPTPPTKDKKRLRSASPPAPTSKRPNMGNSSSQPQHHHLSCNDLSPDWLEQPSTSAGDFQHVESGKLQLTYHTGDIFASAPKNSLLIHACNTQGSWGAGIALAFRQRYPKAYSIYRNFCTKDHDPKSTPVPTGTALLIGPVDGDRQHWIGCLFTSAKYGKAKDRPDAIVANTIASMQMLLELIKMADGEISEVRMCKINSGKFGVPWEKTGEALQGVVVQEGWRGEIEVWEP